MFGTFEFSFNEDILTFGNYFGNFFKNLAICFPIFWSPCLWMTQKLNLEKSLLSIYRHVARLCHIVFEVVQGLPYSDER